MNNRLRTIRKYLGLTQSDFGERLNLKRNTITLIENNQRSITDRTISDICREFSVNESWLRLGEGEMFKKPNSLFELLGDKLDELTQSDKAFLCNFLNMTKQERETLTNMLKKLTKY